MPLKAKQVLRPTPLHITRTDLKVVTRVAKRKQRECTMEAKDSSETRKT